MLAFALANALIAQQPAGSADPHVGARAALHEATGLTATADGFVAIAMHYKAHFTAAGVSFTPALGSAVPHNLPLRWSAPDVWRGERLLHRGEPVAPQAQDHEVHYARGPAVETYAVTPRGLKQSFVFDRPIAGSGDLVVRCRWRSELVPQRAQDGGIDFLANDRGGVRIGQVVGIDAGGRRVLGSLRVDGDVLELVLPDAFVASATFPLVLDPLIGSTYRVMLNSDEFGPDIAVDPVSNRLLAAFLVRYSATDTDAYAALITQFNGIPAAVGALLPIEISTYHVRTLRVAQVRATQRFLVVHDWGPSPFGPFDVLGRSVDLLGNLSVPVSIAATTANEFDPAVGGDASGTDDEAVVVWCTTSGLRGAEVTVAATGAPVVGAVTVLGTGPDLRRPAIGKACGLVPNFVLAWEEGVPAAVHARLVTRDLVTVGAPILLSTTSLDNTRIAVDGADNSFMVCWERVEAAGSFDADIVATVLGSSVGGLSIVQPETPLAATPAIDERNPSLAILGSRYALVYREEGPQLADVVRAILVAPDCTTCGPRHTLTATTAGMRAATPRIAGQWIGNDLLDNAMILFTGIDTLPPFASNLYLQGIEALGPGVPAVDLGGSCGNGGISGTTGGPFVIGNRDFAFRVTGADPGALLLVNLGLPSPGFACGSCVLTLPTVLEIRPNVAGTATSPLVVPCDPAVAGFQIESQWLSLLGVATTCPLLPGLSASGRLLVTLGL